MNAPRLLSGLLFMCTAGWSGQYLISTVAGGAPPATPAQANKTSVGDPPRVTVDTAGNAYFGSLHCVFRVDRNGTLTRIAGTGRWGNSGDGGPAVNAQMAYPEGIAVDTAGAVYVVDREANVVRKIANGIISTFAGTGAAAYGGDGGPASRAQLNGPTGIALDAEGNVYVADTNNNSIRKVSPSGTISTAVGSGAEGNAGDGGPATAAALNRPQGVAAEPGGALYIADTFNSRVRKVAPDGTISTLAGTGISSFNGDGQPAASAALSLPTDVALDSSGRVYIADFGNSRIRRVADGQISTAAGSGGGEPFYEGGNAASVRLSGPTGVAIDAAGNIYIAEASLGSGSGLAAGDFRIWKVLPEGVISTLAGNGMASYSGDGGPAAAAQFHAPAALALDTAGNLYIADRLNHRVRRMAATGLISTVVGTGTAGFEVDFGPPAGAQFHSPGGVAVDAAGKVYVADSLNARVRRLEPGGNIFTFAGNGNFAYFGDAGPANRASVNQPEGVALDVAGNVYIADTLNNVIRKVTADGSISTVAGTGARGFSGDGGPAVEALLNHPHAVVADASGNLYIADTGNHRVRRVDPKGMVSTIAGSGLIGFDGDAGEAVTLSLASPAGVAVDAAGTVYIADTGHNRIRAVAAGAMTTIAGSGECCYSGDGGPANAAALNHPWGLAVDGAGTVYFSETGNNAIRALQPVGGAPYISAVANGASNRPGPIAPGEVVVMFGAGFGPAKLASSQYDDAGRLPTEVAGTRILFNGVAAPILYSSFSQAGAIAPYGISGASVAVTVQYQGSATLPVTVALASAAPAIFTLDSSGTGQVLAANEDGFLNGPDRPARPGSFVTLYATGEGETSPVGSDGKLAVAPLAKPLLPVTATVGGQNAFVQYAGAALGMVAGIMQVNVQIPAGTPAGSAVPILLSVGDASSPAGVTVAVGETR
jgi:trimeric autotransporter adhesin